MRYYSRKSCIIVINDSSQGQTPETIKQDTQAADLFRVFPLPNRITEGCGIFAVKEKSVCLLNLETIKCWSESLNARAAHNGSLKRRDFDIS